MNEGSSRRQYLAINILGIGQTHHNTHESKEIKLAIRQVEFAMKDRGIREYKYGQKR